MSATGKWTQPGVPHKGWICVDIEDLGSPDHVCQMCEVQDVRYVHVMKHAGYAETLRVGCNCAGHMEGDSARARDREAGFKVSCGRRARWLSREWRRSRAGNQYLNIDGFNIIVFRVGGGWSARLSPREGEDGESHKLPTFATEELVKLASFGALIAAKAARARNSRLRSTKSDVGSLRQPRQSDCEGEAPSRSGQYAVGHRTNQGQASPHRASDASCV